MPKLHAKTQQDVLHPSVRDALDLLAVALAEKVLKELKQDKKGTVNGNGLHKVL